MADICGTNETALGNQYSIQLHIVGARSWEKAGMGEDRTVSFMKTKGRLGVRQTKIGLIEGTNCTDILPVAVEWKGIHSLAVQRRRKLTRCQSHHGMT